LLVTIVFKCFNFYNIDYFLGKCYIMLLLTPSFLVKVLNLRESDLINFDQQIVKKNMHMRIEFVAVDNTTF